MEGLSPTADDVPLEFAVIVPAHNVEETLAAQLDALTAQRWDGLWGVVVVDNRSTDATRAIAESYRNQGVRVVMANGGKGVAYVRNEGARRIDARTFAFCDGDDVVHPGWVAAMGGALRHADIVAGRVEADTLNAPWLAKSRPLSKSGGLPTFGSIGFASGGNSGMTRAVFERTGGYDESFVGLEDIEFSLRALAEGFSITFVPDALLAYRYRERLRVVWRQGFYYGRGRPELIRRARQLGLPTPVRRETFKSWAWLAIRLPRLRTRSGRYQWTWVLANRIGVLRGNIALVQKFVEE